MLPAYAELHCLSNFSFLRGASHPEELVERAQALGYTALAVTDECSFSGVVRAHVAAKNAGLPLVIGSEVTLVDGVKLVLLATDRASYGNLSQLITRGRRSAEKGSYALTRDDVATFADGLLALWVPPDPPRQASGIDDATLAAARRLPRSRAAQLGRRRLSRPGVDRRRALRPRRRSREARALRGARARDRPAAGRRRRRPHARSRPALAAGHAHGDPAEAAARRMRLRAPSEWRAAPALARAARVDLSGGAPRRDRRDRASAARFRSTSCATSTRRRSCRRDTRRRRICGSSPTKDWRGGMGSARCPPEVRELIEHELALIAELRYEPYFLTVHDIVAFARSREHPLPGPRLGGQLGRLLRARHHRSRSVADEHAVRAVHLEGAQRAARHRRRLRAPAARGSDAVRLREIRPRPRGARRDAHHLPAEERGARCRPRAGPRSRAGRPALRHVRLVGRPRGQAGTHPRSGVRARQPGARPPRRR